MKWNYNEEYRDQFGLGIHRDILIVPHATNVIPVQGGPPEITSKVPQYKWVPDNGDTKEGHYEPDRDTHGNIIYGEVEWTITNDDIVKEKFRLSHSLNSETNLTFSSCNAAMVQFTIRNNKEYNEEKGYWEPEIPNLQNYEFIEKDPDGTERKITGELSGNACIKVYMYFNGDSSSLIYLGMFNVEEDKVTGNGYERQITGYDFLAFFRDCDIFYWYKHLWTGINKLDDDFKDYTSDGTEEETKPDDYNNDINWVRKPASELYPDRDGRWTIGEALKDLFNNFASYDPIVYNKEKVKVEDPETHEVTTVEKTVAQVGNTVTNPNNYGRTYEEGNGYTGLGMPIKLDPDLFEDEHHNKKEYHIPEEVGPDQFECYGYMDALDIEFYQDPKIMKSESLSMGKFLEDIGLLAGRYPCIRTDRLEDGNYIDPTQHTYEAHENRYQNYECCILTFKPLPDSDYDKKVKNIPESILDNSQIVKGFKYENYDVDDVEIIKIGMNDNTKIEYKRLGKKEREYDKLGLLQTFTFDNNIFCSYLVSESSDEEIKKKLDDYKALRIKIFGKENKNKNMSSGALFEQGYFNIKNHKYRPYELTTYADPCRDVGDRIRINYTDVVTGESLYFYTYILEREMNGIQKCMDTYKAQGDKTGPAFSNYQTSTRYQSGSSYSASSFGYNSTYGGSSSNTVSLGMSPSDLVQYWRNFGIRLLDEPADCQAVFVKGGEGEIDLTKNHLYVTSSYPQETYIKDGDATNPIMVNGDEITVIEGDYVRVKNYNNDDPVIPNIWPWDGSNIIPLYVYTANHKWEYAGTNIDYDVGNSKNVYDMSGSENPEVFLDHEDNYPVVIVDGRDEILGSTNNKLVIRPKNGENNFEYTTYNNTFTWYGGHVSETTISETITREAVFGDYADILALIKDDEQDPGTQYYLAYRFQYPGFWTLPHDYPDLTKKIENETKKYVSLKWSDPQDITDYKPTPATWEGTVIVRKENSAPLHRWDGEKVVRTTTRDKYKTKAYKDEDIKVNKVYYYGFFPYYIKISDPEHPIRFYTFTKVIRVETGIITYSPTIDELDIDRNNVTIFYTITIPVDVTYTSIKLYGKKGKIPACDDTDDIVEDVDPDDESITISDLDYTQYYFTIKCIDSNEAEVSSNTEMADLGFAWDGSEVDIVWSGETNRMSVQIQNSSILFKMYIGSTNIYSFTSPVGSEPSDVKYINVEFLQDTTNEIAKPSFIYKDGTNYMYNQESPTEAQMQDIYVWLQGRAIVPPEYRSYIDTINGTGFFFRDWPQIHDDNWNIDYYPHYPLYIHSYKSYGGSSDFNSNSPWIEETTKGIASLYITEQQTGWGYDTTYEAYDWVYWAVTPDKRTQVGLINKTNQSIGGRSGSSYGWDTDATHTRTDTTGHGYESLSALFYDITRLYRNVNIYVNGELWSKVD